VLKKEQLSAPYYNVGQLRVDLWNDLKAETTKLAHAEKGSSKEKSEIKKSYELITALKGVESYYAFPGLSRLVKLENHLDRFEYTALANLVTETTRELVSESYRRRPDFLREDVDSMGAVEEHEQGEGLRKNYFEVLFVEDMSERDENDLKQKLKELQDPNDQFAYGVVVQRSLQDALIALTFNYNIQAVVIRYAPPFRSKGISEVIKPYIQNVLEIDLSENPEKSLGPIIGDFARKLRPELDTYYVTDSALADLQDTTIKTFRRIFYRMEDLQEIHLTIKRGITERYETPFFTALKEYSQKPTGVFHAMPISRGNSVFKSRWINDFGEFYGRNMFLAETSATTD
jgi:arginine decarboxylase